MPTQTYTPLQTITFSGGESSATFASIPSSYRDLVLQGTLIASGTIDVLIILNSDSTSANYSYQQMKGDGSSSTQSSSGASRLLTNATTSFSAVQINLMDYSATDKFKNYLVRTDLAANYTYALTGRWANTSVVNSFEITTASGTFSAGGTLSLYGIAS